jgi:Amt family ammonium transporter
LCYFGSTLKHRLKIDDALDAFGIHGISGAIGGILVGFFATNEIGPENGVLYSGNSTAGAHQLAIQIVGILFSGGWAFIFSYIIFKVIDLSIGLRVPSEFEEKGKSSGISNVYYF